MANDEWRTPKQVFNALDAEFEFCADMASDDDNNLHEVYFTQESDSLNKVAQRRIIPEPKRWTWEDKDTGRLPEVGCKCVGILSEAIKRVVHVNKHIVAVENEKTLNVCNFTHEEFFRNHKPIETPAEKAQRLRSEWVKHALDLYMSSPKNDVASMGDVYDALLSGELKAPESTE